VTVEGRDKLGRRRRISQSAGRKGTPHRGAAKAGPLIDASPPPVLREAGRAWWTWATGKLAVMGVLDCADTGVLTLGGIAIDNLSTALDVMKGGGNKALILTDTAHGKKLQRHPAQLTLERALEFLRLLYGDLGLTPTARAKFAMPEEADDDPIAQILNERMGGN
jgi:P27 family predicted phage terminase small subunit